VRIADLDEFLKFGSGKVVIYVLIDPCSAAGRESSVKMLLAARCG
jgi:hypothetical protein